MNRGWYTFCRPMRARREETAVSVLASPEPDKLPDPWQVLQVASTWNDGQTLIVPFKASIISDIRKWPPPPLPKEGLCSQTYWHVCSQAWSFPVMTTDAACCSLHLLLHTLSSSILPLDLHRTLSSSFSWNYKEEMVHQYLLNLH